MYDPWSLDLELPFAAELKYASRRSIWETAEHWKGQVQGISHHFSLNLFVSYISYLKQLPGRLRWAIFSLFFFFLCHFHSVYTMPWDFRQATCAGFPWFYPEQMASVGCLW